MVGDMQREVISRLYRIGHTEIEITAPVYMKSPKNLEKFQIERAEKTDDEVVHYLVENVVLSIFSGWTGIMRSAVRRM